MCDDRRCKLLGNHNEFIAIDTFNKALEERNEYLRTHKVIDGTKDPEFMKINNTCKELYEQIKQTGFFDR